MRAKGFSIHVSDFNRAVTFYSRLFSSSPFVEGRKAIFGNGFEIRSDDEWRKSLSLPSDFAIGHSFSSSAIFETDDFKSLIVLLSDSFFLGHVLSLSDNEALVIDDELNCIIVRDSGKRKAAIGSEDIFSSGEKGLTSTSDNWKK